MALILQKNKCQETGVFLKTHGLTETPEYGAWGNLIYRCENKGSPQWNSYGGRGIRVCKRWRTNFMHFLEDMGERPTDGHSIDRIDVNGDYEPENCRWATAQQQANNRTNTRFIGGMSPKELSKQTGLPYSTIANRIRRGWTDERIMNQPRRKYSEGVNAHG